MKTPTASVRNIVLAAVMALPLCTVGGAARADEEMAGPMPAAQDQHGPRGPGRFADDGADAGPPSGGPGHGPGERAGAGAGGPEHGPGFGPGPMPGVGPGRPPFLHGIALTEAQDDKIFAILHAEQPYLREQGKAAAKARQALREMAGADKYDDAKAAALAKEAATAEANLALHHVRTQQKLLAVLTPEQRTQLTAEQPHHPPRP
ncbi:Spy/CpxP family protein refolding chaperone [Duganella callida]|uniref:Periplasmic heavy metal sensor n=1 Tax=Duganella callida TaxID=2561932 RepID=A0A4Y9SWR8_9BURK|nr:periplasmic heavy metal sensor [Duganella callida]TFW29799.1 periplasmic heavy metal sensor [Duganella callida]